MPKLVAFAPCEKVIIDQQGAVSLISLFDGIEIALVPGAEIPGNAVAPKEWAVFTRWEKEASEAARDVIQVMEISYPDGTTFKRSTLALHLQDRLNNAVMNAIGFPIGQEGEYRVAVWLEEDSVATTEKHTAVLTVKYSRPPSE